LAEKSRVKEALLRRELAGLQKEQVIRPGKNGGKALIRRGKGPSLFLLKNSAVIVSGQEARASYLRGGSRFLEKERGEFAPGGKKKERKLGPHSSRSGGRGRPRLLMMEGENGD